MAERRLYMTRRGNVWEVPVGVAGDYLIGEQLISVSNSLVRQGADAGEHFAGFVHRSSLGLDIGTPVQIVRPARVWLPLAGAAHAHVFSDVYSAIDADTISLDASAAGATAMGRAVQVDANRSHVLVDFQAGISVSTGGGTPPPTIMTPRYFGWSADRVIEATDLAGYTSANANTGRLPTQVGNAYLVFAVPAAVGWPSALYLAGGGQDLLPTFDQQAGTIDDGGTDYIVGVSERRQLGVVYGGRQMELRY